MEDKVVISLDRFTSGIIDAVLHHSYVYPIDDIEIKTGYTKDNFKKLHERYSIIKDQYFIEDHDLIAVQSGLQLLLNELNDNDFANLIELRKPQARKLVEILQKAERGEISTITPDMWLINPEDWQIPKTEPKS